MFAENTAMATLEGIETLDLYYFQMVNLIPAIRKQLR
jgi:hypothetical protein